MKAYPERQTSLLAGWSRRTGVFSAVLLATVWTGHHYRLVETPVFLWVLGIVAVLAALALLFSGFAFSKLWNFGDRGGRDLVVGALTALVVLAPYGFAAYQAATLPPLRDISTDTDDPPVLAAAAVRTPDMNALSSPTPGERRLQAQSYPLVNGHSYDLPLDDVIDAVALVVRRQGWQLAGPLPAGEGQREVTIGALARSFVLDLPADVAIRVRDDGGTVTVDMRSASRYTRHDLGDGAARIVAFLAELDQQVAGQVGTAVVE